MPKDTPAEFENCENPEHPGEATGENPEAKPGYLCVYGFFLFATGEVSSILNLVSGTAGAVLELKFPPSPEPPDTGVGTFAVTAP